MSGERKRARNLTCFFVQLSNWHSMCNYPFRHSINGPEVPPQIMDQGADLLFDPHFFPFEWTSVIV